VPSLARRRADGRQGRRRDETDVEIARPDQSVQEIARLMAEVDTGAPPVGENDRLVGMITDRDIAVRVAAAGKDPKQVRVRE
jgi:CBS domain-containing protein